MFSFGSTSNSLQPSKRRRMSKDSITIPTLVPIEHQNKISQPQNEKKKKSEPKKVIPLNNNQRPRMNKTQLTESLLNSFNEVDTLKFKLQDEQKQSEELSKQVLSLNDELSQVKQEAQKFANQALLEVSEVSNELQSIKSQLNNTESRNVELETNLVAERNVAQFLNDRLKETSIELQNMKANTASNSKRTTKGSTNEVLKSCEKLNQNLKDAIKSLSELPVSKIGLL